MSGIGDLLDYPVEDRIAIAISFLESIRGKPCSKLEQYYNEKQGEYDGHSWAFTRSEKV